MNFYSGFTSTNAFSNGWSIISGTYDNNKQVADYNCDTSTGDSAGVFSPYYKLYPQGFKVTAKKFTLPYSSVYVDILYFVKASKFVDFTLLDSNTQLAAKNLNSAEILDVKNHECNYKVSCNNSAKTEVVMSSLQYDGKLTDKYPTVSFTYSRATQNSDWFGILKVIVWSNCVENCYQCSDSKNCQICMKGFSRYTLSNGQKVCDENSGCATPNCYSCIKSKSQCVKCLPGYILTSSNTCQLENSNVCSAGQYYSSSTNKCVSYSTNCLMQQSGQYNKWKDCLQPIDTSKIKCPNEKNILLYEIKNYLVYSCDCQVDFCQDCSSNIKTECNTCKIGYKPNGKTICIFDKCPPGYTKDVDSLECVQNCPGYTNCETCDTTKCLTCLQPGNFYIDSSNPKNCLSCNITNCYVCSGDGKCNQCQIGYSLTSDKLNCQICSVNNCKYCKNGQSNICEICQSNFQISSDNKSCKCDVQGCQTCTDSDGKKCNICQKNYTLNSFSCSCQVMNCSACNANDGSVCDVCNPGLTFNPTSKTCECQINNCKTCSNIIGQCLECVNHYKKSSDQSTCSCDVENCQVCDQTDGLQCKQCIPGFFIDMQTKKCILSVKNCATVDTLNPAKCLQCNTNYELDKTSNQCFCKVKNCEVCSPSNGSVCNTCIKNYSINTCQCQVNNCDECQLTDGLKCNKCSSGYEIDSKQLCKVICQLQNCEKCELPPLNTQQCNQCQVGFIVDGTTKQCVKQPCLVNNCDECELINNQQCMFCKDGYEIDTNSRQCKKLQCLVDNCDECEQPINKQLCKICKDGYIVDTNKQCAIKCLIDNCTDCEQPLTINNQKCKFCQDGYVVDTNTKQCTIKCLIDNCKECEYPLTLNNQLCQTCNDGYYVDSNTKQCRKLECQIDNCDECYLPLTQNNQQCKTCKDGYIVDANTKQCTIKCIIDNCMQCEQPLTLNNQQCKTCNDGYIVDANTKQCTIKCIIDNCLQCEQPLILNNQLCKTCNDGYYVDSNTKQCRKLECQIDNCDECELPLTINNQKCKLCKDGYVVDTNKKQCTIKCIINNCLECEQPLTLNNQLCKTCNDGYYVDTNRKECIQLQCKIDNCNECYLPLTLNNQQCKTCKDGYIAENSKKQCIIKCAIDNCKECESPLTTNNQKCKLCNDGYVVDTNKKQCIKLQCQIDNCDECYQPLTLNNQQCKKCKDGYLVDINTKQCTVKCLVDNCNECMSPLTLKNQLCKTCKDGYMSDPITKQCIIKQIEENYFRAQQIKVDNGYNVTISFEKEVVQKINYEDKFDFKIDGISFKYKFVDQKPKEARVNIQVDENCKNKVLVIHIKDSFFKQANNFQNNENKLVLDNYGYETPEQKKQAEAAKQASQSIQTTLISSMLPIAMIGNFYVLFNTIDLTTFIYFLLFLNIRYPSNVTNFCSVFQNFQMAFIPNLFQVYLTDKDYLQPYTPAKFLEYGNDAYFLNSAGQSYTIVFGILTIYGFLKLFSFLKITGVQAYVQKKIESGWEYNAFFDLIWTVYMYVVVGVFLQFFSFEFTESLSFFNYTLFAMSLIAIFVIPICITIFIAKTPDLTEERIQKQFSSLVGGLKISNIHNSPQQISNKLVHQKSDEEIMNLRSKQVSLNNIQESSNNGIIFDQLSQIGNIHKYRTMKYSRYANVFLYFRKILYAIIIIFMYKHPYAQLVLISFLNLFLVVFYFYIRPHEKNFENIRNGISEAMLIIMQIAISTLVEDKQEEDETDRINVGWLLIACAGFILFIHIITVVLDLLKSLFNLIKDFFVTIYQSYQQRKNKQQEKADNKNNKKDINNLLQLPIGEFGSQIAMKFVRSSTKHLSSKILASSPTRFIQRKSIRRSTTKLNTNFNSNHEDGEKKDQSYNFGQYAPESYKESQVNGQLNVEVSSLDASFAQSHLKYDQHKQFLNEKQNYGDSTYRQTNRLKSADNSAVNSFVNIDNHINLNQSVSNINH